MDRGARAAFDNMDVSLNRFDTIIEWLLVALLAFMPIACGAVHAWSEQVVVVLAAAMTVCFLLKLIFCRDRPVFWTWAYIPVALFILISALQLVSFPEFLVSVISPNTAIVKTELLGDLPGVDALLKSMTFSFYPDATKHDLRLVLAVASAFVVVFNVFRRPDQIKRLLIAISVIGGIVALIAFAQDVLGNGKIYWVIQPPRDPAYSGPFVNHSNYGQFMNLSIGAAFGLLMVKLHEVFAGKKVNPSFVFEYLSSSAARIIWCLVAMIILGAATVAVSLTRGGMLSMLAAACFTTLIMVSGKSLKGSGWVMAVVAIGAFVCVLYLGFDAVYDRFARLRDLHDYEGRWQILKDLLVTFRLFPVLGTGLGTHEVVYPMFDHSTIAALAVHAENEYAQAMEETGLIGLVSLIIFGVIVWLNYARTTRNINLPIRSAAYGLGFGLLAILIHSLSDFGQHLPANAFLSAIFCALLLVLARQGQNQRTPNAELRHSKFRLWLRIVMLAGAGTIWLWAFTGANNYRIAEAHWKKVLGIEKALVKRNWQGTDAEYADLISHAAVAAEYQPENIKYRYWLNVYRWHSISQLTDPDTTEVVIPDASMPLIRDIASEFHKVRVLCPTFGATYSTLGQIEMSILCNPAGAEMIRKGFRLAPCDPIACFAAGCLDISEGRTDNGVEKFERAVQLDGRLFRDVVNIYINHLSRPYLAVSLAGDDIDRLIYVSGVLEDMQYNDLTEQVRRKIKLLLEQKCRQPNSPALAFVLLADIYRQQRDNEAAIEYYRYALARDYGRVHWRYALAKLLTEMGRIQDAMHEARICLRLRPQFKPAQKLIEDLSIHPAAFSEEAKSL